MNQIRLFVVVSAEDDVETDVLEGQQLLVLVLLDARRVEDGPVVLADADVGALVLVLRQEENGFQITFNGIKRIAVISNLIASSFYPHFVSQFKMVLPIPSCSGRT